MPVLRIDCVYIHIYQRVRAVLKLARLPVEAILASAAPRIATAVPIAVLPAVVQRQDVYVLCVREDAGAVREGWIFPVVEAFVPSAEPHVFPPFGSYVLKR